MVMGVALSTVGNTWSWAWHFSQYTHVGWLPNLILGLSACKHLLLLSILSSLAIQFDILDNSSYLTVKPGEAFPSLTN